MNTIKSIIEELESPKTKTVSISMEDYSGCTTCEEIVILLKELEMRREKDKKYRWHDLRIDPTDVPDGKRFVEVRTEDSFPYYFGWYDDETVEGGAWYDAAGFSMQPVKWREIEEEVSQ